jgi:hypothetical protein
MHVCLFVPGGGRAGVPHVRACRAGRVPQRQRTAACCKAL